MLGCSVARGLGNATKSAEHTLDAELNIFWPGGSSRDRILVHIELGRPVQNVYVETFDGKLRDECQNANWFANSFEARAKIGAWKEEYNEERPHSSLGNLAPRVFARRGGLAEAKVMSSGELGVE